MSSLKVLLGCSFVDPWVKRSPDAVVTGDVKRASAVLAATCLLSLGIMANAVAATTLVPKQITDRYTLNLPGGPNFKIGAEPLNTKAIGNKLYMGFNVSNGGGRYEPAVLDITTGKSAVLKTIYANHHLGSMPAEFTQVGSTVFFAATDAANGRELWKTDGTAAGTVLVKNIRPGFFSSEPSDFIECNGKLLFYADDGQHDKELWTSDGTAAGTVMVKDINPGSGYRSSWVSNLLRWKNIVYFQARDTPLNGELWRTDGTETGTYKVKDIDPSSSNPRGLTVYKDALYFQARSPADGNAELWRTDGTESGTVLVKAITNSAEEINNLRVTAGRLFFSAPGSGSRSGYDLWTSDGTTEGTVVVKKINPTGFSSPHSFAEYDGRLYFVATDGVHGSQIWRSDGTAAGTEMVHEMHNRPGRPHTDPYGLIPYKGLLLFRQRTDEHGIEWWQTDGTPGGLRIVADIERGDGHSLSSIAGSSNFYYGLVNGVMYFMAYTRTSGIEVWKFIEKVVITSHPRPQLVAMGAAAQVHVGYGPTVGATVQWRRNGRNVGGATSTSYQIAAVTLTHAGKYSARVTLGQDNETCRDAVLSVVDRFVPDSNVAALGTITFNVSAAGEGLTYQWRRDGNVVSNTADKRISGATSAKLAISKATPADEGSYTCDVSMGSQMISTLPATARLVTRPIVDASPPPQGAICSDFLWTPVATQFPGSFIMTGLPAGLRYDPKTGQISGTPTAAGTFTVKMSATNAAGAGAVQSFTLRVAPLPVGSVGSFAGLVGRHSALNSSLGGSFSAVVATAGTLTGRLVMGAVSYPIAGRLTVSAPGSSPAFTVNLPRRGQPSLVLTLSFSPASNLIEGTVSDGIETAPVEAHRNIWNIKTAPAAQHQGRYNASLQIATGLGKAAVPQGAGWTQTTVTASGVVTLSGKAGDGSALTCSTHLWPDGRWPVFVALYAGKGSIHGGQGITLGGSAPDYLDNRLTSANLDWLKTTAAGAGDRVYRAGFPLTELNTDGSKWVAPAPGTNVLDVADAAENARIQFEHGGLDMAAEGGSVSQIFQLTAASVAKFATAANPCKTTLTISTVNGTFAGSFVLTDPNPAGNGVVKRTVTFSGLLLSHREAGWGGFLLHGLPNPQASPPVTATQSPILSGQVWLGVP